MKHPMDEDQVEVGEESVSGPERPFRSAERSQEKHSQIESHYHIYLSGKHSLV